MRGFDINTVDLHRFGQGQPGVLRLRSGSTHQLTWDDVEWFAKLVWGESMDGDEVHAASVIWTVAARADMFYPAVQRLGSLGAFVRAFSSPMHGSTTQPRILHASWADIPPYARKMALAWSLGMLPNPIPGAVDFANRNQRVGSVLTPIAWIGFRGRTVGNVFYTRAGAGGGWARFNVLAPDGSTSSVTREAFERYGRAAQRGVGGTLIDLVPGGRAVLRQITGD